MARTHRFLIAALLLLAGLTRAEDNAGSAAYRAIADSIVRVETLSGHGTGFVIDAEGYVLTNFHVVLMPGPLTVHFNKLGNRTDVSLQQVTLVGVHPTYDLALLKVTLPRGVSATPATIAATVPSAGTPVFAVGFPGSRSGVLANAITGGEIVDPESKQDGGIFLKSTTAVNPGNSGGPLVTADGVVVGINTFFRKDNEIADFFAVPAATAARDRSVFVPIAARARQLELAAPYKKAALEHMAAGRNDAAEQAFFYAMIWDPRDPDLYIGYIECGAAERSRTTTMAILEHVMTVAPAAEARICLAVANSMARADKRRLPMLRRGVDSRQPGAEDCARAIITDLYVIGDAVQQAFLYGVIAARSELSRDQRGFDKAMRRCNSTQAAEVRALLAKWAEEETVAELPWQLVESPDTAIQAPAWGSLPGPDLQAAEKLPELDAPTVLAQVRSLAAPGLLSVAAMPDGRAYLAYADSPIIEVRSLPDLAVVDRLVVARLPVHLSRLGHLLVIAESQSRQIAVYNTRSQQMEFLIPTEREPYRVDGDPVTLNLAVAMLPAKPLLLSLNAQRPHGDLRLFRADAADAQRPAGFVYPLGKAGRIYWSSTYASGDLTSLQPPFYRIGDTETYVAGRADGRSVRIDAQVEFLGELAPAVGLVLAVPERGTTGVFYHSAGAGAAALVVYDIAAAACRGVAILPSDTRLDLTPAARARTVFSPEARLLLQVGSDELRAIQIGGGR